ncbi:DUF4232 domain-containing protein [Streptomyces sp. NPDC006992]|uniref:DUF4232 domain-containing protein n=1 Tax=Streptomyces sp. NPDC006992 TaxID=3155601 RepID=UPI0033D78C6C
MKTVRRARRTLRTTGLLAAAVAAAFSLTACQDGGGTSDSAADAPSSSPGASRSVGQEKESGGGESGSGGGSATAGNGKAAGGDSSAKGGGEGTGKGGYGQVCGANDLSWSARSESQAGGYILLSVTAKPGISCTLPGTPPVVAFGSDGTEAAPAEQAVGEQTKLSGGTTAYAGVNPKTTGTDGGKELSAVIATVSRDDRTDPVSLDTGSITVDKPVVTNWHTVPQDAVPGA